jgi:hypothetical protein
MYTGLILPSAASAALVPICRRIRMSLRQDRGLSRSWPLVLVLPKSSWLVENPGAAAQSLNRLIALVISGGSVGSVGRVVARGRPVKLTAVSQDASRVKQTAPLPGRAAFAISLVTLSADL